MRSLLASRRSIFPVGLFAATAVALSGCGGSSNSSSSTPIVKTPTTSVKMTEVKLVSDLPGAAVTDPNLKNPWGISYSPTGAFWVSDNTSGLSTLYSGTGSIVSLVVSVPGAAGSAVGPVTGQVYNGTSDFVIPGSSAGVFIFDSEDGLITAWNSGVKAVVVNDQSKSGAVYKGLAMGTSAGANFLFATNFNSGKVDVFDKSFTLIKSFTDTSIPSGFAPFGISNIGGQLVVSFAKQDAAKHDDVPAVGNGYVDVFSTNGVLVQRLVSNGLLNSPWGIAQAPSGFSSVGGDILVGNFGDGKVNAYDPSTGKLVATLQDSTGAPLVISGLWALIFGNGGQGGAKNVLYFTAGPNQEADGLLGSLSPASN